jgi:hypothetical protein
MSALQLLLLLMPFPCCMCGPMTPAALLSNQIWLQVLHSDLKVRNVLSAG